MNSNCKLVTFDQYCHKCKHHDVPTWDDPCYDCLLEPVNEYTNKPIFYEEEKK